MRSRGIIIAALALVLLLTGCGKTGKLDEGDCACVVRLEDIPSEFKMLGDNIQESLNIKVVLQNITTEKTYEFALNMENDFKQEAFLYPGVYKVNSCFAAPYYICMDTETRQQDLEVSGDKENEITVYIENPEEFSDLVWDMQPIREVTQLDRFSRQIQWKGQIIDLEHIMDYMEFSSDQTVRGYEQITLFNSDNRVRVTLQNQTAQEVSWQECKLIRVQFERPNAIFAQDVKVGMPVKDIVHAQEGIYGTPDSLTGSILFAVGADSVGMVYYDEASGDRLTLDSDGSGDYIYRITYEFAVYE
ncbi:MAG: hypothetical protein K2O34_03090 [Acetatifactor sp.]|nr:hypothetical protein [Acetatifactor sp.]